MSDYIYGKNSVLELLSQGKRNVNKILFSKGMHADAKLNKIVDLAKEQGIVFQFVPKEKFQQFSDVSHQGVVAYVSPIEYMEIDDFLEKGGKNRRIVILDGVEDPHNFGSIVRTAVCAGYDAIVMPSRRNSIVNSTVEKSSAGAINHIDIIMVNSLSSAVMKLKDNDFWIIASDAVSADNYFEIDYTNMNFAIVMGSEKSGISQSVLKQADFKVKIPMYNDFDSLNVANAASIIMYEAVKQIAQKGIL
ncbi:MAG: 23S rRNA (guanosine(2251)-2'-O)-methyltransferase RlmB [Candidatus Gastranaerophilales bacterium]|nr:23S rRNA (guanosine(2251)-2'-O)-methyltransferase RlmB [Candidatus Gastranaerophilales bacterium]